MWDSYIEMYDIKSMTTVTQRRVGSALWGSSDASREVGQYHWELDW